MNLTAEERHDPLCQYFNYENHLQYFRTTGKNAKVNKPQNIIMYV